MARLVASPGRTLGEVLKHSTVKIDHSIHAGILMATAVVPHDVQVDAAHGGFLLPAGKFSALSGKASLVTRLLVTPHLDHLSWATAPVLVASLSELLTGHGYRELAHQSMDHARESLRGRDEDRVALYGRGTMQVELRLKVALRGGSRRATLVKHDGDALLLSVWVWDERLT